MPWVPSGEDGVVYATLHAEEGHSLAGDKVEGGEMNRGRCILPCLNSGIENFVPKTCLRLGSSYELGSRATLGEKQDHHSP